MPEGLRQPEQWVQAALGHWRAREPERFVHLPGRLDNPRWAAPEEVKYQRALAALDAEVDAFNTRTMKERNTLEEALAVARVTADSGHRRLLTARGDDLAEAVADALRLLGFDVTNMDAVKAGSQKLEDLRVRDPEDDEWEALVEVRGYKGGASPHDLLRMGRFVQRYRDAEGRWPSARWYVVNQFVGDDPATRPPVLSSDEPDLNEFAEQSGLAIDTADLFDLAVSVTERDLDGADVRAHLKASTGRYEQRLD